MDQNLITSSFASGVEIGLKTDATAQAQRNASLADTVSVTNC
jgi:hypothetical protein